VKKVIIDQESSCSIFIPVVPCQRLFHTEALVHYCQSLSFSMFYLFLLDHGMSVM